MIRTIAVAALVGLAAFMPQTAWGASFDCEKATKPDEIAICESPELSALDSEMAGLWYGYSKVPMLMGGSGARHDAAEAFLATRTNCGSDTGCLARVYRERVRTLEAELDSAMNEYAQMLNGPSASDDEVGPVLSGYAKQCTALGGSLAPGAQPWTMTADLDGDRQPDYVLNTQGLQCTGSATAFCGNGGCQIDIALSSRGFRSPTSALGGQPTLIQSEAGTILQVWVDGTNCDLTGDSNEECWATYEWSDGRLRASYSRRPVAR